MRLKELKTACDEYSSLGKSFDEATEIFRLETGPTFEISRHQGRALMTWLNKWGCRQFAKAQHDYALSEFREWAESNQSLLPNVEAPLMSLSDAALVSVACAYDKLRSRLASQKRRADSLIPVRFGPTGAAKILYALRPNCCPPWDKPIRERFQWDGDEASYIAFLQKVKADCLDLIKDADRSGIEAKDIPQKVGRPLSSPPKLVDEYYWITITKRKSPA
jgi:hypothetical protein